MDSYDSESRRIFQHFFEIAEAPPVLQALLWRHYEFGLLAQIKKTVFLNVSIVDFWGDSIEFRTR